MTTTTTYAFYNNLNLKIIIIIIITKSQLIRKITIFNSWILKHYDKRLYCQKKRREN